MQANRYIHHNTSWKLRWNLPAPLMTWTFSPLSSASRCTPHAHVCRWSAPLVACRGRLLEPWLRSHPAEHILRGGRLQASCVQRRRHSRLQLIAIFLTLGCCYTPPSSFTDYTTLRPWRPEWRPTPRPNPTTWYNTGIKGIPQLDT